MPQTFHDDFDDDIDDEHGLDDDLFDDEEDIDGFDTVPCPSCGEPVADEAQWCPHCGEWIVIRHAWATGRKRLLYLLGAVAAVAGLIALTTC